MTSLPPGWEWTTIGEVADIQLGRQRSPKNHDGPHMRPYLRSANVRWNGIDVSDVKTMNFEPAEAATFELQPGDLLLNEASGSPNEVGKPAIWEGQIEGCCFQNTLLRVRSLGPLVGYLYWYCMAAARSGAFGEAARGVNIRHLGKKGLAGFPIPVAPMAEQARIVDAVEQHLSALDSAMSFVTRAKARIDHVYISLADDLIEGSGPLAPVVDFAGDGRNAMAIGPFGSNLRVSDYRDTGVPLVFVRDVRRRTFGGPGTRFVSPDKATELASHIARSGDVLVTKMGDPPGESAVYEGPDAVITADCIKLTPGSAAHGPFIAAALRTRRARAQVLAATKGVAQKKVSLGRFKTAVEIPMAALEVQFDIASRLETAEAHLTQLRQAVAAIEARSSTARRAILRAAFSGDLVPQDPTEEPAQELLDRIRRADGGAPTAPARAALSS